MMGIDTPRLKPRVKIWGELTISAQKMSRWLIGKPHFKILIIIDIVEKRVR
jgi:hypothetical protein